MKVTTQRFFALKVKIATLPLAPRPPQKKKGLVLLKHFKYCGNKQTHICDMTASNGSPSSDTTLKRVMVDVDKGLSP